MTAFDYGKPIRLFVTFKKSGDALVPMDGHVASVKGAIKQYRVVHAGGDVHVRQSVLSHDVLCNAGFYRAIRRDRPAGDDRQRCPAGRVGRGGLRGPCSTRASAPSQNAADRSIAASEGGNTGVSIGGYYPDAGRSSSSSFVCLARAERAWADGPTQRKHWQHVPPAVEITRERSTPADPVHRFIQDVRAGKHRGGMSIRRDYKLLPTRRCYRWGGSPRHSPVRALRRPAGPPARNS